MEHIAPHERDALAGAPCITYVYAEGAFVHVSEEDDYDWDGYETLRAVVAYARSKDCQFVRIDRDASMIAELPAFDDEPD